MKLFDTENWSRNKQYEFFMGYDDPSFGITANVDVTELVHYCKKNALSFFLASLYCSTKALNQVENLRLRLKDDQVYLFDNIEAGSTIFKEDNTFTFAYFESKDTIAEFCKSGKQKIAGYKENEDFDANRDRLDIIYYSVIPWVNFTAIKHPKRDDPSFSIPKIIFGKYADQNDRILMPVSIEAHHALLDGYHIGLYFDAFRNEIENLSS
jgi:chloramphenicol O-acetyltransferase type A